MKRPYKILVWIVSACLATGCAEHESITALVPPASNSSPGSHGEFINKLWQTPLGESFRRFMSDPMKREEFTLRLGQMSDRLLGEPATAITKISIIQMLSEEMYQAGQLTDEGEKRLRLLAGRVSLRRINMSQSPTEKMVGHAALILVASLPFGSPIVRGALKEAGQNILQRIRTLFGRPSTAVQGSTGSSWGRLLTGDVARDYDLRHSTAFFLNAFGIYSFVYLFWHEFHNVPSGEPIESGKISVYDYSRFLKEAARF